MLDLTPLTQPLTPDQAADVDRRAKAGEFGPSGGPGGLQIAVAVGIGIIALGMFGNFVAMFVRMNRQMGAVPGGMGMPVFFKVFALFFIGILVAVLYRAVRSLGSSGDWKKLAAFALANGLHFRRRSSNPSYPGLLFGIGSDRASSNHVWSAEGDLADVGRYSYTTGSDDNETTHSWTYAAFRLPRPMPHLVLDNRSNDGFGSNLPARFAKSQRMSLGGVFDEQWTLYAPNGYGQDTYQVFAPDVMEALVSNQYTFDMEIVDDWLFLYSKNGSPSDPRLWQQVESIREAVVSRIANRGYVDRRPEAAPAATALAGNPGQPVPPVAPQGRRLRQRTNWAGLLILVVIALQWYLMRYGLPTIPR